LNKRLTKRVLLIGWDAADWKVINPLLDGGKMPGLESLVNQGVMGNLATLDPPMSPILWTSIATGMHADKHGIINFTEPAPQSGGIRPVMGSSRKVKAIWNILTQKKMKTHVVGWWPSHPAEPINGISISNFYQRAHAPIDKPWPMRPGTVYPKRLEPVFDRLRIHPAELTEAHILPFVPRAAEVDQEKEKRLSTLARLIADCSTIHAASTWILETQEWDFMAVYTDIKQDPYAEQEAMEQLIALGYVEKPDENKEKALERTMNESQYYLARVHINKHQYDKAVPILEALYEKKSDQIRYGFQLARCYQIVGRLRESKTVIEQIIKGEKKEYPQLDLLRGSLALSERLYHQALEYFEKAEKSEPRLPTLHQQIGHTYLRMKKLDDAERAYRKAIEIDPDSHIGHHGLAQVYLRKGRNREAAESALNAVGLIYHYPMAHYALGLALTRLGHFERAAEAFEVCLVMVPTMRKARRMLIRLYQTKLGQLDKAKIHRKALGN